MCDTVASVRTITSDAQFHVNLVSNFRLEHRRNVHRRRSIRTNASSLARNIQDLKLHTDIPISLQQINVAGKSVPLVLADVDAVMQMYIDAGQGDRDPYWTIPWPSSIAMVQELLERPEFVHGLRVADLGCGLGLGGLAAALSHADQVVFLDREPLALQCACVNAFMNGFEINKKENQISFSGLGALLQDRESLPSDIYRLLSSIQGQNPDENKKNTKIASQIFDWSQPVSIKQFDVILACDVLYEAFSVEPVAQLVPKLLKFNSGRLILADPPLRTKHNRDKFVELLGEDGFQVEEYAERVVATWDEGKQCMQNVPITFMVFKRGSFGDTISVKQFSCTSRISPFLPIKASLWDRHGL